MIPLHLIVNRTRARVDVHSRMWNRLITATGQPRLNGDDDEEAASGSDDSNAAIRKVAESREPAIGNSGTPGSNTEDAGLSE